MSLSKRHSQTASGDAVARGEAAHPLEAVTENGDGKLLSHGTTRRSNTTTTTTTREDTLSTKRRKKIGIVGSGVSGLSCAHFLASEYDVTLFEYADVLGMDSSSVDFAGARMDVPLRTFSEDYYHNLTELYDCIGVRTAPAHYAFACFEYEKPDEPSYFRYGSVINHWFFRLFGVRQFSFPAVSLRRLPRFLSHVYHFYRFNREGPHSLDSGACVGKTFKEYVLERHPEDFYYEMMLPMLSVVCTCSFEAVGNYPAEVLVDYIAGRGHARRFGSSTRRAIDGTRDVVAKLARNCNRVHTGCKILAVEPSHMNGSFKRPKIEWMELATGERHFSEEFDEIIVATQANQALEMLGPHASPLHTRALGDIEYETTLTVLHTDHNLLPKREQDKSAVNLGVDLKRKCSDCTIWMNKIDTDLTRRMGGNNAYQTWNPLVVPEKDKVVAQYFFQRPVLTMRTATALDTLASLQGVGNLWFVGAYSLYSMPLLENGTRSAIRICNRLLKSSKIPEIGTQISGASFRKRRPDLVAYCDKPMRDEMSVALANDRRRVVILETLAGAAAVAGVIAVASLFVRRDGKEEF